MVAALPGALAVPVARATEPERGAIAFNRDVRPVLSDKCFRCHGPDANQRKAGLRLDRLEGMRRQRDGVTPVVPGDLERSELWRRITSQDPAERMPPPESAKELTRDQIGLLGRWIREGADWEGHWAFVPPVRANPPRIDPDGPAANPIDGFILDRLRREGLEPSPPADRASLIRRITLDLTGLPPTLPEIDAFVADPDRDAYERVVDRLLASPRFGERMAVEWLDAARYGDTSVFHADGPRDMWPWRDWVIDAYNSNMPFDRFTVAQLAGDLLPGATWRELTASGFNRNNGTTDEGGAIDEEYRVAYAVDRVRTTSIVWLGLSLECAQCHEHKYDPISQEEYYRFFAFFNQSADRGMQTRSGNAEPLIQVPNAKARPEAARVRRRIAGLEAALDTRRDEAEPAFEAWLREAPERVGPAPELPSGLLAHFPLDEAEGKEVRDAVDPRRQGTIHGEGGWSRGRFSHALTTDGQLHVEIPGVGDFERTEQFSLGAWIRFDQGVSGAPLARMDDGNFHRGFDLLVDRGRLAVHLIHRWPGNAIKVITKKPASPGAWHHVFVTYDGSSRAEGVRIHVDGAAQEFDTVVDELGDTIRTGRPFTLGRRSPGSPFRGDIDDVRLYGRRLDDEEVRRLATVDPLSPLLALEEDRRSPAQTETLRSHYLETVDTAYGRLRDELAGARVRLAELEKPLSTVMVMRDMDTPRTTFVLQRGEYDAPLEDRPVEPGVPSLLPPLGPDAPRDRLGLARWIVDPRNPLPARVTVNRLWKMLFGVGIVKTAEDFGSQGEWPSHPRLLDWLAVDFIESGWDTKRMIKQIVMSRTYRQTSRIPPALRVRDPENRLLARGPRFRLAAEFIRDQALSVSGLLVEKIGGPGVKPYQPPGLWNEVSLDGNVRFVQDHGEKLYRRSLYTYWKRSAPAPSMVLFDVPTREKCTVRRSRTNTPLQALVLMNDPQYVEAARRLARRMMLEAGEGPEAKIEYGFRLATSGRPGPETVDLLGRGRDEELAAFRRDPARAEELLAVGESPRDATLDPSEHAAWTLVASTILNLDETITRR